MIAKSHPETSDDTKKKHETKNKKQKKKTTINGHKWIVLITKQVKT